MPGRGDSVLLQRGPCILWLLVLALPLVLTSRVWGDPVAGEIFPWRQPDGTPIEVRIWGDEFYRVVESLDGYTLVRDPTTGSACYAKRSPDGDTLLSTGVPVHKATAVGLHLEPHLRVSADVARAEADAVRDRAERDIADALKIFRAKGLDPAPPSSGMVEGLCLIVDFSDEVGTLLPDEVDRYCNEVGYANYGNNGSVRDYFYDVSEGHLTYTNYVPTAYYRAQYLKSYYDDPDVSYGQRARGLIVEALNDLNSQGFDFSQYDSNQDGLIDAINCFYAGRRSGIWAAGLWPHAGSMSFSADDVSAFRYQITDLRDQLTLRTFCHENGHMLCGWPDLYDYGYESRGVGNFCLMCYGASSTNPAEPCAYFKDISNWSTTTLLTRTQSALTVTAGVNEVYKYEHPTRSNEYYLIENRQRTGRDAFIPDAGIAIWHIDTQGNNSDEQMTPDRHYLVTLVQADGRWDLELDVNSGDSTDLWSTPDHTECTPETDPNTHWWDGSGSDLYLREISASGPTMTFTFGADCNENGVPDDQDITNGTSADLNENGMPDECEDCNANDLLDDCDLSCAAADGRCNQPGCGLSADCDGNGIPDECETDSDEDGFIDPCDNCPDVANPDQADDGDGDGAGDACDNCFDTPNPDQCDMDNDGAGDACATVPAETALAFDRSSLELAYIAHHAAFDFGTDDLTIELWFKADTDGFFFDKRSDLGWGEVGLFLSLAEGGHMFFGLEVAEQHYDGTEISSTTVGLDDGLWHHAAGVRDGNQMRLYVDGQLEADATLNLTMNVTSTADAVLGARHNQVAHLRGVIDELRVWQIAKTQEEIERDRAISMTGNEPALVYYQNFCGGCSGQVLTDASPNDVPGWLGFSVDEVETEDPTWILSNVPIAPPPDTDSDGIPDPFDNCPDTPNTDQADTDDDGVGDACDNCPNQPNPDQSNVDDDADGDVCDDDMDGDGLSNDQDNCPVTVNPGQSDDDADAVGDACDACPDTISGVPVDDTGCPMPLPGDTDRDGDVDQEDFGHFQACLAGPGTVLTDPACMTADLDGDQDVDADDFGILQACMSGPNIPADPSCAD